jgi:hypothetical protein
MKRWFCAVPALLMALLLPGVALAGERVLSINGNDGNATWFITGEPSLVMNGFDLNTFGIALPAVIDRISIAVDTPTPGVPIDVVVYQDANGGSPVDAALAGSTQVDITQAGTFTVTLPQPITVTQPAVWVGFYLPVDFTFIADTSGPSVLTYWAWTPGGRFDLGNLASAAVLGPADGSAPVNLNMNGRARITLEITPAGGTAVGTSVAGAPPIVQTSGGAADLAVLATYAGCANVLWDTADDRLSLREAYDTDCRIVPAWQSPAAPLGYVRRGEMYDLQFYNEFGFTVTSRLPAAITHCIRPAVADLAAAVIGNAYGQPRTWRILPSERFGDLVCAEVRYGGGLAYFVPG